MKPTKFSAVDSVLDDRMPSSDGNEAFAFTRIELLVIVATLALLAVTLLPALARTHVKPQGTQCLNNLRQITMAWLVYAGDNNGKFPPNPDYEAYPRWVAGDMRGGMVGGIYDSLPDAVNSALLVDPNYSLLGPYLKNPAVFKCPADLSTWSAHNVPGQNETPRVRSYSMNCAVGPAVNGTLQDPGRNVIGHWLSSGNASPPGGSPWRVYIKENDFTSSQSPADLWVLLDEHPDSINDACFAVQMPVNPVATYFIDVPAKYHLNNACNFSFADGHVETHQWQMPAAIPPTYFNVDQQPAIGGTGTTVPGDPDVMWLAHHTSALARGASVLFQP